MKYVSNRVTESHSHTDPTTGFVFNDTNFVTQTKKEKGKEEKNMKAQNSQPAAPMQATPPPKILKSTKKLANESIMDIDLDLDEDEETGWRTLRDPNNVEGKAFLDKKEEERKQAEKEKKDKLSQEDFDQLDSMPIVSKSVIDEKAIQMKKDRALPPIIGASINFEELNAWLALLDTEQKRERIIIYVYRSLPICNRQLADPNGPKSIDILKGEPINLTDFIATHGGGKYKLLVNDLERNRVSKTSNGTIYTVFFEVPFSEHIPIIRWEELELGHKNNKGFITWCQGKGILDGQGRYIGDQMNPAVNGVSGARSINGASTRNDDITLKLLDHALKNNNSGDGNGRKVVEENASVAAMRLVTDASQKQMQMLVDSVKSNSTDKDTLSGIAQLITPLLAARNNSGELTTKDILLMMQAQQDAQMKMMMMLMEANKPKESNSKIGELKELFQLAREFTGMGAGKEVSLTDRALNVIEENAGPLLNVIGGFMNQNKGSQSAAPIQSMNPLQPMQPSPDFLSQPIPQMQPLTPHNPSTLTQDKGNDQMNLDPEVIQLVQVIKSQGPLITNALAQSISGDVFADSLITMFGRPTYAMIINCGQQKILRAMQNVPEFWQASAGIYGQPTLIQFVDDFVNRDAIIAAEQAGNLSEQIQPEDKSHLQSQPQPQTIDITNPNTPIQDKLAAMNRS